MKASVVVLSYNSAASLCRCLESLVVQRCSFPFEVIVADDASMDSSRPVIARYAEQYPSVIVPIYRPANLGIVANFRQVLPTVKGAYLAFCDADDWWSDPDKLAKQVAFLEQDPHCAIVHTDYHVFSEDQGTTEYCHNRHRRKAVPPTAGFEQLLQWNCICPVTACVRMDWVRRIQDRLDYTEHGWLTQDYPLWLFVLAESGMPARYMDEATATYCKRSGSVSNTSVKADYYAFKVSTWKIRQYFLDHYPVSPQVRQAAVDNKIGDRIVYHLFYNRRFDDLRDFAKTSPYRLRSLKAKFLAALFRIGDGNAQPQVTHHRHPHV
jgi:glycosyltransferase involved in cell wall biosynthesis